MVRYTLRVATAADVPALAALYEASVRTVAPSHYSAEQVDAWAAFAGTPRSFRRFVLRATTFIAEEDTGPVGFAGLDSDGRIASLYVHPDRMRQGIGATLLRRVLDEASARGLRRLYTEANPFSRALFERYGFTVDAVETVRRRGVAFTRHRMVREESAPPNPAPSPVFTAP